MEFIVKIQAIFCPEQQTCYREEMQERNDELNALPATVQVGNKTVRVTNVQAFMGVCCFPCSCSDNCKLDGNCCVPKFISIENTMDTDQVKSECIVPSVHSYADKDLPPPSKYYSSFFMITQCFEGKSNVVLDEKC